MLQPLKEKEVSVGIGTAPSYGLDMAVFPARVREIFSSPQRPDWGPTQPPIKWVTGGSFSGNGCGMKLTTHLHLVPRSRMVELYLHFTMCFHGIVLN
jgi:hypothetical protein